MFVRDLCFSNSGPNLTVTAVHMPKSQSVFAKALLGNVVFPSHNTIMSPQDELHIPDIRDTSLRRDG